MRVSERRTKEGETEIWKEEWMMKETDGRESHLFNHSRVSLSSATRVLLESSRVWLTARASRPGGGVWGVGGQGLFSLYTSPVLPPLP